MWAYKQSSSCEDLEDTDSDASWSVRYTACQGSPGQWCNRRHFLAQTLAAAWLFLVAVLLDGLELHQESIPRAAGSQESQGREQRYRVGRVTLAGSFDLPPGIHYFDVEASSLHVPVSVLLTCFGRPNWGTESPDSFGVIFPGQLEAGSNDLLLEECQRGLAALTAADSWL